MPSEIKTLKRFRRRFLLITMSLVAVTTFVAFAIVDANNYQAVSGEIESVLSRAVQPDSTVAGRGDGNGNKSQKDKSGNTWNKKLAHSIPLCVVATPVSSLGTYVTVADSITLDSTTLQAAVTAALSDEDESCSQSLGEGASYSGTLEEYGLYYRVALEQGSLRIAFVPQSVLWNDLLSRTLALAGCWVLLMLVLLGIMVALSHYVVRPVEEAWRDQQRFIADASHELKTPLTVILADVSILKDGHDKTAEEQAVWIEGIEAEAERMRELTESMLTLAQVDSGIDMAPVMFDVDFSSVVEGQVLQFDAVAFERGLVFEDRVCEGLHVKGDELRLENMVKTLLENACKYAGHPGTVTVTLDTVKNDAVLSIHNTGDPIPAEDLPHIFDRFYRSDKSRVQEGEALSFGLGLSIAKSTAELHHGSIGVSSDADGTTFTVKIPLVK